MTILIGHSSINELGKAHGGKPGNQTKLEVCTRKWYYGNWNYVLRPKKSDIAEKSAKFVEDICKGGYVGYDQSGTGKTEGRNSLYQQAKAVNFDGSKVKVKCESDCSSFMHCAAIAGGANLTYGSNGFTTRTMVDGFKKSGDYEVLSDKKYLTSDKYLKRGDILVKVGSHTVMALENGANVVETKSTLYKTTSDLNLRSSASSTNSNNILAILPKNTYVSILKDGTKWVQVQTVANNKVFTGYVSKSYLTTIDISKNERRKINI